MGFKDFWRRELHVARYGQSRAFRVRKWLIIIALAIFLYHLHGARVLAIVLLASSVLSICLHFFLSYKTKRWTQSWGPYKRIKLDGE